MMPYDEVCYQRLAQHGKKENLIQEKTKSKN